MKKLSIIVLLSFLWLSVFPQKITIEGITYKINKDEATVVAANIYIKNANIQSFVEHKGKKYPVTAIGRSSFLEWQCSTPFANNTLLRTVTIPNSVNSIARDAFAGCSNLTEIIFPDGKVELNAGYKDPTRKVNNHLSFHDCFSITNVKCHNGRIPVQIVDNLPQTCPFVIAYKNGLLNNNVNNQVLIKDNNKIRNDQVESNDSPEINTNKVEEDKNTIVTSDVDIDIPFFNPSNKNTFAIIIANENYQKESNVEFAKNDGQIFKKYCRNVLSIPEKNIHLVQNGTLNDMIFELDWIEEVCKAYNGDASVIFYYAGHGIPDEKNGKAYLLPIDGTGKNLRTCYSVDELYKILGDMPANKVVVFMDACFSGSKRSGEVLSSARGVAIKAKTETPKGKMIVLTAANGEETAYSYKEENHGLFTYFLLKKLQETDGKVSLEELANYINEHVRRFSLVENGKSQTPTIMVSPVLGESWKKMMLK